MLIINIIILMKIFVVFIAIIFNIIMIIITTGTSNDRIRLRGQEDRPSVVIKS